MNNNQHKCDICKNNVSKYEIIKKRNGELTSIYYCENCHKKYTENSLPIENIMDAFGSFFNPNEPPEDNYYRPYNPQSKKSSLINNHCVDVTNEAKNGNIDPIIGRDTEINRIINILSRRTKNNPVLIGEPGVGKTAIIEGLALKIAEGNVPSKLRDKTILSLDITSVTAGTMYRGMFEERLKKIIKEVEKNKDIILFVDELHVLMGAGSSIESNMDAANILKPYLTKGKIQLIGATTLEEYRKIEKDSALERRFQKIIVDAPNLEQTLNVLKGIRSKYEDFHGVHFSDDVLNACVQIADKYIFERQMPDKAIDLMDEVGARLNVKHNISNDDIKNKILDLLHQMKTAGDAEDFEKAFELKKMRLQLEAEAKERFEKYTTTIEEVRQIAEKITGIPITELTEKDKSNLLNLEEKLSKKVIGQGEAVKQVVKAVKRKRINLRKVKKPTVFLFAGPTGVGKTELTKKLSEELFGNEKSMIRFDMSEFMEAHSISKLIGSPPGYVGHEKAGELTEQVRRRPYSVILLDEFEKAHKDVQHLFLQVFDDGRLTDSQGTTIDFTNTIIILTSNLGTSSPKTVGLLIEKEEEHYLKAINEHFKPEFINRIDSIIPFNQLKKEDVLEIAKIMVVDLENGLKEHSIELKISESVLNWIAEKGYDEKYGARPLYRTITKYIEDPIADFLIENDDTRKIEIEISNETLEPVVK